MHCPPDLRIVHGGNVGTECDEGRGKDGRYVELLSQRARFVRDAIDRLNRHAGDVDLVSLVEVERVGRVRPKSEGDPPQVRHSPYIVLVGIELQLLFRLPDVDHVRAGCVGVSPPFATARHIIGVDDRGRRRGELHQKCRARRLEVDLNGTIVDDPQAFQFARIAPNHLVGADDIAQVGGTSERRARVRRRLRAECPRQGERDILRRDRRAVGEPGVIAKLNTVGEPIGADLDPLRELRYGLEVFVESGQAPEDLAGHECRVDIRGDRGIERRRIVDRAGEA